MSGEPSIETGTDPSLPVDQQPDSDGPPQIGDSQDGETLDKVRAQWLRRAADQIEETGEDAVAWLRQRADQLDPPEQVGIDPEGSG